MDCRSASAERAQQEKEAASPARAAPYPLIVPAIEAHFKLMFFPQKAEFSQ